MSYLRSFEDYYTRRILKERDLNKSRGICVDDEFCDKFNQYYGHGRRDPIEMTRLLKKEGVIETRPSEKGIMIYLPGEAPKRRFYINDIEKLPGVCRRDDFYDPGEKKCENDGEICDEGFGIHNIGANSMIKSCRYGKWNTREDDPPCKNPEEDIERKRRKLRLTPKRKSIHKIIKKKIQRKCVCTKK